MPANAAIDGDLATLRLRRATPGDHPAIVGVIDDWAGGRRLRASLPRVWLEHFGATSLVAVTEARPLAGFIVGFRSPDRPDTAVVHLAGVDPNLRRRGVGRALHDTFAEAMRAAGARHIETHVWPGDPVLLTVHRALGFRVDDGPGTRPLYGTPAYPDHDRPGEDRVRLIRDL